MQRSVIRRDTQLQWYNRLTEFQKKYSDHPNQLRGLRFCANLKKGTKKIWCPTLKIRGPAHLKITVHSNKGRKLIVPNLAENASFNQFEDADSSSRLIWWSSNIKNRKKLNFCKSALFQYCQLQVKLQMGVASDFQGGAPNFFCSFLQVCTKSESSELIGVI